MKKDRKKVVMAISGGVDSSVAAMILRDQKYEVIGVFMRLFDHGIEGERAARLVCKNLGIKFYPVNLSDSFSREVKEYFLKSYKNGITPNPCVRCNKLIKFGELIRIKNDLGADFLATGHYVRLERDYKKSKIKFLTKLYKGLDIFKDQSYFLYNLSQKQLREILFPLGEMKKEDVRILAEKAGIPNLKSESQDVCFLVEDGKILDHNDFLKDNINLKAGDIKTTNGKVIGRHQGLPLYTIGQRRGVEVGGTGPYYVSKIDYKTNTLYVVDNVNDSSLFRASFKLKELNWISGEDPKLPFECEVVIRYKHKQVKCEVLKKEKNVYFVKLKASERAVTSGQSAVFYQKNELLGGGVIC